MIERRKRPNYTGEFKQDAVKLVVEHGYTCRQAAERLGIASSNVTRWVRLHRDEEQELGEMGATSRELEAEIRRLRKENQRLQMEREILKKAAAFFAKESN
ncbi:transposase [Thermodesulfobacteriota bacterium]